MKRWKRVLFTCGGTAGHVNPAIALAQRIKQECPDAEFLFVGAERGLERDLLEKAGYPFRTVHVSNFHRSFAPHELRHNLVSVFNLARSPSEARRILLDFQPEAAIGTGGYASYPAIKAAAKMGIPTAVHESNMIPGLTTKLLEPVVDRIMVGFEACRANYKHPDKVIVTGTPVRGDFFTRTKAEAKRELGVSDGRPLVVSFWGSLGASGMNRQMADFIALEAAKTPFYHIHSAGKAGYPVIQAILQGKGVTETNGDSVRLVEYLYNMPLVMRAADLVISRAGASTLSELTALGVPAILVPSPYVTNHHQEKNAKALADAGGAVVLLEPECSGRLLFQTVTELLRDKERLDAMASAMAALGVRDATERILETVEGIVK